MLSKRSVMIVSGDHTLCTVLAERIALNGEFAMSKAETAGEAETKIAARNAQFDAIILDVTLPDGNGRDLCAKLRRSGLKVPIIMLTGSDCESDVVCGLASGASDCIAKPIRFAELLARLRTHLRTFDDSVDAVFTIGPYRFCPATKVLQELSCNRRIRLTGKETAILRFLYQADGQLVSPETLVNEVWGYNVAVDMQALWSQIWRIRQKIEPDPSNARMLVSEGGGYRLDLGAALLAA